MSRSHTPPHRRTAPSIPPPLMAPSICRGGSADRRAVPGCRGRERPRPPEIRFGRSCQAIVDHAGPAGFSPSRRLPPPPRRPMCSGCVRSPPKPASLNGLDHIARHHPAALRASIFFNPATRDVVRLRVGKTMRAGITFGQTREATLVKDRERVVLELPPPGEFPCDERFHSADAAAAAAS
jgi:hypothetical protein